MGWKMHPCCRRSELPQFSTVPVPLDSSVNWSVSFAPVTNWADVGNTTMP